MVIVRHLDQQDRDRQRKTYRIAFPHELTEESVTAWIRSISGTLRGSSMRLTGTPTIGFEVWADSSGITHRLKVPWQHADYVIAQLRSLVPGIRVTPEDKWPRRNWTRAVEVGLTNSSRPLRIFSAADMAASLLAAMQAMDAGEEMIMQWVVTPAVPRHKPVYRQARSDQFNLRHLSSGNLANRDEVAERRDKLDEPNMLAVLRVGAVASSPVRADHLIYRVRASLASTRGPATRFVKRFVPRPMLQDRINKAAGSSNYPAQLSASELSALVAWPIGSPFVTGLPPSMSRQLPATELVPRAGRVIGRSNFPGNERPIAIDYVSARKHTHVVGPTGSGKTVLLANMIKQDMEAGYGVVLIDAKGGDSNNLFNAALDYVPRSRIEQTIVLDVNDTAMPVGFNILQQGNPRVVIDELTELFESMYDSKSVWTREVLYHGLRTLGATPGSSFTDLGPLLVPMSSDEVDWRNAVTRNLKDKELRQFWQRFENQPRAAQDRIVQPVMDRIWQLTARPELRNIIGQSDSSFRMADVVAENKILLVNLGGLAEETASLAGTLLMNALWHAVKTTPAEPPTYLYLDEFQKMIKLPIDPESMLAEARGFGLGMTLAHQHLAQLPTELRAAVSANARSKIVFQTTAADAAGFAREFGTSVTEKDFMHLGKYEVLARVATGDGVSSPLTMTTMEPARPVGAAKAVRYVSRQNYGRPVAQVEREMEERRRPEAKPSRPRPKVSGQDWPEGF
jgi:hypothetical protein